MHNLNPPQPGEIYYLSNKFNELVKLEVIELVLGKSGQSMLVEYKLWQGEFSILNEWFVPGKVSLHFWNCWLRDGKMSKINSPQEGLAFIIKHGCS